MKASSAISWEFFNPRNIINKRFPHDPQSISSKSHFNPQLCQRNATKRKTIIKNKMRDLCGNETQTIKLKVLFIQKIPSDSEIFVYN